MLIRPLVFADVSIPDAAQYEMMVEFFRGNGSLEYVGGSWKLRLLVPFLVALILGDPIFSLNVVSVIFTLLSVFYFHKFLLYFKINEKQRLLGIVLFITSATTIIVGSTPLTDSAGIFFVILTLYFYTSLEKNLKKDIIIEIVITVGVLARETVMFVVPVIVLWSIIDDQIPSRLNKFKMLKSGLYYIGLIGALPLVVLIILRSFAPTQMLAPINIVRIIDNISQLFEAIILTTIAQLLSLSLIGIFGNLSNVIKKDKTVWKLIIGMGSFFVLLVYSTMYANMSCRFFWVFFIFVIPFFLISIGGLHQSSI